MTLVGSAVNSVVRMVIPFSRLFHGPHRIALCGQRFGNIDVRTSEIKTRLRVLRIGGGEFLSNRECFLPAIDRAGIVATRP